MKDEGRLSRSARLSLRATTIDQGRRCERWIWWIGWSPWFGDVPRIQWIGRPRRFVWKGRACSKWRAKSSKVNEDNRVGELPEGGRDRSGNGRFRTSRVRHDGQELGQWRTRLITVAENLSPYFPHGTSWWMCGLVGVIVVKISGYGVKTRWNGLIDNVQHVHMYTHDCI